MENQNQEELVQILAKLGLSRNDVLVYLALLRSGKAGSGQITRDSGLHTSRVHESLNKLAQAGLVAYFFTTSKRVYQAENPERLLETAREIEQETKRVLPRLLEMGKQKEEKVNARLYEGYKGVRTVYNSSLERLKPGEEHFVFSAFGEPDFFVPFFINWNKRRVAKGIKLRVVINEDAKEKILSYVKGRLARYKILPKDFSTPTSTNIFGNTVAMVVWLEKPIAFVIESKEAADSFRKYFEILWKSDILRPKARPQIGR
ncbi:MAG: hypothetical protein HY519_00190 [Candidatus Aenigmarchaeota archaeon]|nr:hypothetical protein [Candidatus Aenigmarchaeota archaeon]